VGLHATVTNKIRGLAFTEVPKLVDSEWVRMPACRSIVLPPPRTTTIRPMVSSAKGYVHREV